MRRCSSQTQATVSTVSAYINLRLPDSNYKWINCAQSTSSPREINKHNGYSGKFDFGMQNRHRETAVFWGRQFASEISFLARILPLLSTLPHSLGCLTMRELIFAMEDMLRSKIIPASVNDDWNFWLTHRFLTYCGRHVRCFCASFLDRETSVRSNQALSNFPCAASSDCDRCCLCSLVTFVSMEHRLYTDSASGTVEHTLNRSPTSMPHLAGLKQLTHLEKQYTYAEVQSACLSQKHEVLLFL